MDPQSFTSSQPAPSMDIFDHMLEGCQIIGFDWRYRYLNDAAIAHSRQAKADLLGRTMMEVYPGIEETPLFKTLATSMAARTPAKLLNEFVYPDQSNAWFELMVYPVNDGIFIMSQDISERKRAEEDLHASESKYRTLVENIPQKIFTKDKNLVYLSCNENFARDLAIRPEEFAGRTDFDFFSKEMAEKYRADDLRVLQSGQTLAIEERYFRADQDSWIQTIKTPIREKDGTVSGILGIFWDITERKRAENEIRQSEARYRGLFEHMLEGFAYCKMEYENDLPVDFTYLEVNRKFEELTGLANVTGKKVSEVIPDVQASNPELFEIYGRVAATGNPERFETYIPSLGIWFSISVYSYEKGYFIAVFDTITERKQAEQELRDREAQYRAVLETTTDGFWVTDIQGRLLEVNDAYVRRSGYTRRELLGMYITDLEARESPEETQAHIEKNMRNGAELFETVHRAKDGSLWQVEINASYSTIAGGRLFTFIRDIGQRKRMEEALRQRLAEAEAEYTLSAALRTANTVDEALPVLLDQAQAALDCQAGNIWLYHPASGDLHLAVARGPFQPYAGTTLLPGRGIAGMVFSSGQVYQSIDLASDPLARPPAGVIFPAGQAGICVPIRTSEETIGVLMVSFPTTRQVTPQQVKLISSLAEMAGVALHRIRLHEETARQMKQLQVVRSIDQAITSTLDLKLTLNILLEHITSQLKVDAASVLLLQPSTGMLDFAAGHGFRTRAIERARVHMSTIQGMFHQDKGSAPIQPKAPPERLPSKIVLNVSNCGLERAGLMADEGFVTYNCVSLVAKGVQKGILEIFHRSPLYPDADWLNFLETLAGQAAIAIDNSQLFENLQLANWNLSNAYDATIEGWSHALDLRDKETEGHTLRVTELTLKLARRMAVTENELTFIRWGGLLHDIGKMGIPDHILLKPGPLNEEEWVMMRKHPRFAFEMLTPIKYLGRAVDIPYCHHEKWDGTGYPRRLSGNEIPLMARIFSIVDVWDAISSDRPYRPAFSTEHALSYIQAEKGTSFEPEVVESFIEMIKNSGDGG